MNATLPRDERLRSTKAMKRLFDLGKGGFVYPFRYVYIVADSPGASTETVGTESVAQETREQRHTMPRVLFTVPKRYHKRANKRNLLRRRTKEAYRLNKSLLEGSAGRGLDIAFIYSVKEVAEYKRIENAVKRVLSQISESM